MIKSIGGVARMTREQRAQLAADVREVTDEQSRPCGLPDELSVAWTKQDDRSEERP